jgi:hypothetical protein
VILGYFEIGPWQPIDFFLKAALRLVICPAIHAGQDLYFAATMGLIGNQRTDF